MKVWLNQQPLSLPAGATLADAVAAVRPAEPFAAALNLQFVPKGQYAQTALAEGDRIELISPVTGG
ncbi:MAG: sulfur carrier protein ThiS [Serpentinimonas sp.]|nr:MAG: thiamine biosynthesis protein ThiS [Comamonadaceae bacterium BICA1-1]MDO9610667.1 sulfur carrier protein ThiS [Serpentinimonas sp.]